MIELVNLSGGHKYFLRVETQTEKIILTKAFIQNKINYHHVFSNNISSTVEVNYKNIDGLKKILKDYDLEIIEALCNQETEV